MKFSIDQIKEVLKRKGYLFFDKNRIYNVNIIGVRSAVENTNSFDDYIYFIYRNETKTEQIFEFPVTTDPGTYWLEHPLNPKGTAILMPGQYRGSHKIGLHRGQYTALVQNNKLKVWRDNTKEGRIHKSGIIYKGFFGINIHRSNPKNESTIVNKWSAGCTVFKRAKDFDFFMETCKKSKDIYGNSFTYTLLEEQDFHFQNITNET